MTRLTRWIRRLLGLPPLPDCCYCNRPETATVNLRGEWYCTDCLCDY